MIPAINHQNRRIFKSTEKNRIKHSLVSALRVSVVVKNVKNFCQIYIEIFFKQIKHLFQSNIYYMFIVFKLKKLDVFSPGTVKKLNLFCLKSLSV